MVKGRIVLPKAWYDLVDTVFPDDLEGVKDGDKVDHAITDPEPYYDDQRMMSAKLPDGAIINVYLCSGQSNYWASYDIADAKGNVLYESEPMDSFYEELEAPGYSVEVDFR